MMASSSSDHGPKPEAGGGGGAESSEAAMANDQLLLYRGIVAKRAKKERGCTAKERISKMPPCTAGKRSSIYRGVTRHRWTGRYEAHLWDKTTWNQNQNKKGKQGLSLSHAGTRTHTHTQTGTYIYVMQTDICFTFFLHMKWLARLVFPVYLGAYDDEEAAARAYDLAALKYWGPGTLINFPVTDYTRDLNEMQNVSREEYLASLRRKSSGFSRGISKYRGLSSRWDSSLGRMAGSEYFSSLNYGDDSAAESEFVGSFCIERKIDLTNYIKWWGSNKTRQPESISKSSEQTKHGYHEDVGSELKTLEWLIQPTEPYQMPRLGMNVEGRRPKGSSVSCLNILSQSGAYKNLQEKASKKQENSNENDENENKNGVNKMDYGKAIEKPTSHDSGSERLGAPLGMSGGLSLQRNTCPLTPFLSAPLLTNYSTIDPLDPILWTSPVPSLPAGLSRNSEVTKTEASSTYTFFRPEE